MVIIPLTDIVLCIQILRRFRSYNWLYKLEPNYSKNINSSIMLPIQKLLVEPIMDMVKLEHV